jgi:hypothetical protein
MSSTNAWLFWLNVAAAVLNGVVFAYDPTATVNLGVACFNILAAAAAVIWLRRARHPLND